MHSSLYLSKFYYFIFLFLIILSCVIITLENPSFCKFHSISISEVLSNQELNPCIYPQLSINTKSESNDLIILISSGSRFLYQNYIQCSIRSFNYHCEDPMIGAKIEWLEDTGIIISEELCYSTVRKNKEKLQEKGKIFVSSKPSSECYYMTHKIIPYHEISINIQQTMIDSYSLTFHNYPFNLLNCNYNPNRCVAPIITSDTQNSYFIYELNINHNMELNRLIYISNKIKYLNTNMNQINSDIIQLDSNENYVITINKNVTANKSFYFMNNSIYASLNLIQMYDNIFYKIINPDSSDQIEILNLTLIRNNFEIKTFQEFHKANPIIMLNIRSNLVNNMLLHHHKDINNFKCQELTNIVYDMSFHVITDSLHIITIDYLISNNIFYRQYNYFLKGICERAKPKVIKPAPPKVPKIQKTLPAPSNTHVLDNPTPQIKEPLYKDAIFTLKIIVRENNSIRR